MDELPVINSCGRYVCCYLTGAWLFFTFDASLNVSVVEKCVKWKGEGGSGPAGAHEISSFLCFIHSESCFGMEDDGWQL
jgi:hypothetical protein